LNGFERKEDVGWSLQPTRAFEEVQLIKQTFE